MIGSILSKTIDLVVLSAKQRDLVATLREQVSDEIAINHSMVRSHLKHYPAIRQTTKDAVPLLSGLKTTAYLRVSSGELPLKRIFPDKLTKPARPQQSDGKGTRQYLDWIKDDKTIADLLRRFQRKLELLRTPLNDKPTLVDIRYLAFMLMVIDKSLKKG